LHRVIKQKAVHFVKTFSREDKTLTVEEKMVEVARAKSLIASFFGKFSE